MALPGSTLVSAAFVVQFEVPGAELVLHHPAEVADAVDAEVAEEGLGRHQVQVEEVPPLLPAQQRLQHHDDLVGGAAAAGAGVRADDGAAAVRGDEAAIASRAATACSTVKQVCTTPSAGSEPGTLDQSRSAPGGENEMVVAEGLAACRDHGLRRGIDGRRSVVDEADALARQRAGERDLERLRPAPAHHHPGQAGDEREVRLGGDERQFDALPQSRRN